MAFYTNMMPFFILTAVLGAGYIAYHFYRTDRPVAIGAVLGAIAGAVGPLIFMLPLKSCTFEPERDAVDFGFGLVLFFAGAALLVVGTEKLSHFFIAGSEGKANLLAGQTTEGVFKTSFMVPLLLLAPSIAILAVFIYYPAFETFRLSTLLFRLGAPRTPFVCVRSFTELMDPHFSPGFFALLAGVVIIRMVIFYMDRTGNTRSDWYGRIKLLFNVSLVALIFLFFRQLWAERYALTFFSTAFISGMIVVLALTISLAIAYLAYQPIKGANIYRTLLIWPYAISAPIAGILFFIMFDPNAGIIDHFLETITGIGLPSYREDAWQSRGVVIMAGVWKILGYGILFYIAGLQTVSTTLLEAAEIDGANAWQRLRNVIIPALAPITFFLIITTLTYTFFDLFGTVDILTRGAPAGATSVAIYEIYRIGIQTKDLGRAAAQAIILFMAVIAVTVWQFRRGAVTE